MEKKNSWMKTRHAVVTAILRHTFAHYIRLKYGITTEPFREQGDRPYLIIMNHQTAYDQFFVAMSFRGPVYYIASEDIFSMGWVSDIIRWVAGPIPIKKQTMDLQAVKTCLKVAREGGTICLAPEGNRTYHGRTVYMKPGIASLAKKLGLPLAIYRIEGGYGIHPRWSDVVRRGKMRAYVSRVIEPEEMAAMTTDELFSLISKELWVDEAADTGIYRHKKNAEFLERVVYTCPHCGFSPFESNGDEIRCTTCGTRIRHTDTKQLQGIDKPFPYRYVADWYDAQCDYVNQADLLAMTQTPTFRDRAALSLVHPYKHKELLKKDAEICLYGDRITVDQKVFPFSECGTVTVLGKNKLNIYIGKELFQLKGSKRFNALKYMNFYNRYKNMTTGDHNGQFLGL